jgi:hypothetical protein
MSKTILNMESPVTQSLAAIKALLQWKGRASDPLPQFVELGKEESRLVLVLSNKKDCFYTVTSKTCSCPARGWHPNQPCKHQRKYFHEVKATIKPTASEPLIKRGNFKPFDEMPSEEKARATPLYVDTTRDATPREIAYQEMKMIREFWPCEA